MSSEDVSREIYKKFIEALTNPANYLMPGNTNTFNTPFSTANPYTQSVDTFRSDWLSITNLWIKSMFDYNSKLLDIFQKELEHHNRLSEVLALQFVTNLKPRNGG